MTETLGERIRRLREQIGLTQEQLADRASISRQALSLYEGDSRQLTSDRILVFADLFHVSTDYLLGHQKYQTIDVSGLTQKEQSLICDLVVVMSEINERLKPDGK